MNVLICSQYDEGQVAEVSLKLREKGINVVLLERYRRDQFITYHYNHENVLGLLNCCGKEYSLDSKTFPIIWYRPKPMIVSEFPGEMGKLEEKFCIQEWRSVLLSLEIFLKQTKWINPILSSQRADNKAYQLKVASEVGLKIPHTFITNDSHQALELFKHQRVVYKTLNGFFSSKKAIYTNEIKSEEVKDNEVSIAMAPGIFQQYIEKRHELRVTVVGEKIFVVKINSQEFDQTTIDWRRKPDASLYQMGSLSETTKVNLLKFHHYFNLTYAAYDFIVDLSGNEIFIECNPSGQWLWLENILGIGVSQWMADECMRYVNCNYSA